MSRTQRTIVPREQASSMRPERISHTLRALEICGILSAHRGFVSSDTLIRGIQELHPESQIEESGIKRSMRTLTSLAAEQIVESRPGRGYRLVSPARKVPSGPEWVLPFLTRYLAFSNPNAVYHPALHSVVHRHGAQSLYYLIQFQTACERNVAVRFLYTKSGESKGQERRVQIAGVHIRGHRVVLLGRDLQKKRVRQYLLTRVTGPVRLEEQPMSMPPPQLSAYSDSLSLFLGAPAVDVKMRFKPEVAADVCREFFHDSQIISEGAAGVVVCLRVNSQQEVFWLLSRYMGNVELLEPRPWRNEYAKQLRAAAKIHGDQGSK